MDQDLRLFCERWLEKADIYREGDIKDCFDKFFTLFVVYNALYGETARRLIQNGTIKVNQDTDKKSATEHVPTYLGHSALAHAIKSDIVTIQAVNDFVGYIERGDFYLHTNKSTGEADKSDDLKHVQKINNGSDKEFCESCLVFIYKARCNMFHGGKQFHPYQGNLLRPMMIVLSKVITELMRKLMICI
jgi:hypothetical protein